MRFIKLFFLLSLVTATQAYADGMSLKTFCNAKKANLVTKLTVQNYNAIAGQLINFRLSNTSSVWNVVNKENTTLQNYVKTAYLTGSIVDVCINSQGEALGMEMTYKKN